MTKFPTKRKQITEVTHPCGSEGQTQKRRASGNGRTAVSGSLNFGCRSRRETSQNSTTALNFSEKGFSGATMIAPERTISCAAKSFAQVGFIFRISCWVVNEDWFYEKVFNHRGAMKKQGFCPNQLTPPPPAPSPYLGTIPTFDHFDQLSVSFRFLGGRYWQHLCGSLHNSCLRHVLLLQEKTGADFIIGSLPIASISHLLLTCSIVA